MALVDPYSPCPCGSGQKYKWCCQKVEAYAERVQRLVDNGQYESALKPLDEGLAKVPGNPWLSTRKALVQLHLNQFDEPPGSRLRAIAPETSRQPGRIDPVDAAGTRNGGPDRGGRPVPASDVGSSRRRTSGRLASLASLVGSVAGPGGIFRGGAQAPGTCRSTWAAAS